MQYLRQFAFAQTVAFAVVTLILVLDIQIDNLLIYYENYFIISY